MLEAYPKDVRARSSAWTKKIYHKAREANPEAMEDHLVATD